MSEETKVEYREDVAISREASRRLRQELRLFYPVTKEEQAIEDIVIAPLQSRQVAGVQDEFESIYQKYGLIQPVYNFNTLYLIYEQSDVLEECIDAYIENIDGFGYQLQYLGKDQTQKTPEEMEQKQELEDFFNYANDTESWTTIRKFMRKDLEVLGNAAFEILRNVNGGIGMVHYAPFKTFRCTKMHPDIVTKQVKLKRKGKVITVPMGKYFRRWAQVREAEQVVRWFKSFGDPRPMDATTGEFLETVKPGTILATELMHFKIDCGGSTYGVPRWMGDVPDVLGRRSSQYINYDLMNSQGIPPMVVMVSGGTLTDESVQELKTIIRGMRGKENWNRVGLLESTPENTGLEDRGTAKIELKNLTEYRKDDLMFANYLTKTEESIRHTFRLTRMYTGSSENFSHATSTVARILAEEQVFMPKRQDFDETIERQIINAELGIYAWKLVSKGPKIVGSKELAAGVDAFSKVGAFTINHAISMANEAFGLQMSPFSETWANYPIPIVLKLVELGQLGEIEEITGGEATPPTTGELRVIRGNVEKMEQVTEKIMDSDVFSEKEKNLYKRLLMIQQAIVAKEPDEQATGT